MEKYLLHDASLIKREDVQKYESNAVVEKSFDGALPKFLTAFLCERKITGLEGTEANH